ncbi:AraC family transcriptional regulator [Amycolatopsis sp.]|uniref:AraC family transcriptional regulator n=1 Tax=Amycolatopsis sp. TaxID=37632 RepID=UPI002CE68419|nr:AraC family transcriptional regulator [Amycolatopsis sp.]HVV11176.1 AraC family transcriptional regulator [Amycolatopsis sp.]
MEHPLARFNVLRSHDLDEMRDQLSRIMCRHGLSLAGGAEPLDAIINSRGSRHFVFNFVRYGPPVNVDPGCTRTFTALQIPLRGRALVRNGNRAVVSTPGLMVVTDPHEPLYMELSRNTELVLARIDWAFVQRTMGSLLGMEIPWRISFRLALDVTSKRARGWHRMLMEFMSSVARPEVWFPNSMSLPWLEERLVSDLIYLQGNTYTEILAARPCPVSPRMFREALDLIESVPEEPHTESSIAARFDVSVRALQEAFRQYIDSSISEQLVLARLHRAYLDLRWAYPGEVTVQEIATRWGFADPGFTRLYRAIYHEHPQQTLFR